MTMHPETVTRPDNVRRPVTIPELTCLLINLLELQLWKGCSNTGCKQRMCASYRRRDSKRPARELSRLSARASATSLATIDGAEDLLCPDLVKVLLPDRAPEDRPSFDHVIDQVLDRLNERSRNEDKPEEGGAMTRTDPKSFPQQLFNTSTFRFFLRQTKFDATGKMLLRPEFAEARRRRAVFEVIQKLKQWIFLKGKGTYIEKASMESNGAVRRLYGQRLMPNPPAATRKYHAMFSKLLTEAFHTLTDYMIEEYTLPYPAQDNAWYEDSAAAALATTLLLVLGKFMRGEGVFSGYPMDALWDDVDSPPGTPWTVWPFMWMQVIFLRNWDGELTVDGPSIAHTALDVLKELQRKLEIPSMELCSSSHPSLNDPTQLANAWMHFSNDPARMGRQGSEEDMSSARLAERLCVTKFPTLLRADVVTVAFRSICYQRMREAMDASLINVKVLQRCFRPLMHSGNHWPPQVPSLQYGTLRPAMSTLLTFQVRREHLLEDTYNELWRRQKRELLRPLRVKIVSEFLDQGNDQGGVSQELLRLAMLEILDPDHGMFTTDESTHMNWFGQSCMEPAYKFELAGLLIALSVQNGYTLPLNFPLTLYRKLLGEMIRLPSQIVDDWPDLARSLSELQQYEGDDVEDVFGLDFTYTYRSFDKVEERNMLKSFPNLRVKMGLSEHIGEPAPSYAVPVTSENRFYYIQGYIMMLTDESIEYEYNAFAKGFKRVLHERILKTVTPEILKSLVEGVQQEIDTQALENITKYEGWQDSEGHILRNFWDVVHAFSSERKKRLLKFVTASDRVPVNGIQTLPFKIDKGIDINLLPTSSTCFGALRLPAYPTKEDLEWKLNMALDNTEGFGLA